MKRTMIVCVICLTTCVSMRVGKFDIQMRNIYDIRKGQHNIKMGQRSFNPLDKLLFHYNARLDAVLETVQSYDVCYPLGGSSPTSRFTITAFNVTDLMPRGRGGYAFITQGGVNSGVLCLQLKTQRGEGYNFNIDIWGYYI